MVVDTPSSRHKMPSTGSGAKAILPEPRSVEKRFPISLLIPALLAAVIFLGQANADTVITVTNGTGRNTANRLAFYDANRDRKSTRLNSSHGYISYAVF